MAALFNDPPLIHYKNSIHMRNRRQSMRDRNHRFAVHHAVKRCLNGRLDFAVQRAGGFIEQ